MKTIFICQLDSERQHQIRKAVSRYYADLMPDMTGSELAEAVENVMSEKIVNVIDEIREYM